MQGEAEQALAGSVAVTRGQVASALAASLFGWSLDLFDLFIILYLAPTIGPLFFPSSVPTLSLAGVYGAFAVTLLMRPLGSAFFGAYADRQGRKRALFAAVVGVGVATALMGAVPTIAQAGLLAPVLFLLLRLIQGVFVGGVVASTHTIGTETVAPRWRGLVSGLTGSGGAGIGGLLASIVYYVVSAVFVGPRFAVWGWRFMFFSGILSSLVGLFLFRWLEESPLWEQLRSGGAKVEKAPVRALFSRRYVPVLAVNLMVAAGGASQYYLTSGFLPTFLKVINHLPQRQIGEILIASNLAIVVWASLVGHVSELIGRRPLFLLVGAVNLVATPLLYFALARSGPELVGRIALLAVVLACLGNASIAAILIFLNERFPTAVRATGTGLSWNVGFAVGGMMPTFTTLASPHISDLPRSVATFLGAMTLVYLLGGLITPETRGRFE